MLFGVAAHDFLHDQAVVDGQGEVVRRRWGIERIDATGAGGDHDAATENRRENAEALRDFHWTIPVGRHTRSEDLNTDRRLAIRV